MYSSRKCLSRALRAALLVVTKDARACAKWADLTKAVCSRISKEECQEICTKDQNPTACDLVKSMK